MNKTRTFQEVQGILSIGYIYVIVMGILKETLYYKQIGINILDYSGILDVLISPISSLTSSIFEFFFFIGLIFLIFLAPRYLATKKDKKWFEMLFKLDPILNDDDVRNSLFNTFILLASIALIGFFVGSGLGSGHKINQKIENSEINYNDKLNFINGDLYDVEILGKNSTYVFYLTKESKTVKVTPINGIIKYMEEVK